MCRDYKHTRALVLSLMQNTIKFKHKSIELLLLGDNRLALKFARELSTKLDLREVYEYVKLKTGNKCIDTQTVPKEYIEDVEQLNDTFQHKILVMEACLKLADYFYKEGKESLAVGLLNRAMEHDNSKLYSKEFNLLKTISTDMSCMTSTESVMSDIKRKVIEYHWSKNKHHPEFWDDCNNMNDIDLAELACDWYSRSKQFDTDLKEFIDKKQKPRFRFLDSKWKTIYTYCFILLNS